MRTFWEWLRGRPPRASDEAIQALAKSELDVREAEQRGVQADRTAGELRAILRANHFDTILAEAMRPRP